MTSREPIYDKPEPEPPKPYIGYYESMAEARRRSKEAHKRVQDGYKQIEFTLLMMLLVCIAALVVGIVRGIASQDDVCVKEEIRLMPLYERGPKHHMQGRKIGYVNDKVCVEWKDFTESKQPKKPFKWPKPVY